MGLERNHCQSCGTQEGEFADREVDGIPMVLCSDCRDTLDVQTEQKSERREATRDRRQNQDRRAGGYRTDCKDWSDRRRGERRKR